MDRTTQRSKLTAFVVGTGLLVLGVAGCGLTAPDDPSTARVTATGQSPTGTFKLITSTDFTVVYDPDQDIQRVSLNTADTVVADLPFERDFGFTESLRFYAGAGSPDGEQEVDLNLELLIEDQRRFEESGRIVTQLLELIYILNR